MEATVVSDYIAHLDAKRRLTLSGARYDYYQVKEYDNGCIILEPRQLIVPETISVRTLHMMDESVRNLKQGKVSQPIDLSGGESVCEEG